MIAFFLAAALLPFEAVEPHMGTLVRIRLYAHDQSQAQVAFRAAFDRIRQLDEILSDYRPDSELNQVCRTAVGKPLKVSADLFTVLAASRSLAEESGGAFDITLGPVIRLWRQARTSGVLPDPQAIREASQRCGFRKLRLDATAHTAELAQAGMQLDVGGIAKGYAADAAIEVLKQRGIASALAAVSGDLACSAAPPGRKGWRISLDSFSRVVELTDSAVSTSGNSEQHLDVDGKRYSHIIDPATGMGLTTDITVSVIAPRGITADGLSTAISVLGRERGIALARRHPGVTALVTHNPRRAATCR